MHAQYIPQRYTPLVAAADVLHIPKPDVTDTAPFQQVLPWPRRPPINRSAPPRCTETNDGSGSGSDRVPVGADTSRGSQTQGDGCTGLPRRAGKGPSSSSAAATSASAVCSQSSAPKAEQPGRPPPLPPAACLRPGLSRRLRRASPHSRSRMVDRGRLTRVRLRGAPFVVAPTPRESGATRGRWNRCMHRRATWEDERLARRGRTTNERWEDETGLQSGGRTRGGDGATLPTAI
eukprot:GHVU01204866.1.p1 GENE.GHVU01204866.1~~GHVU01204866.1.p1  ORF type:complete len:234 (-),score=17.88 GHVU01204866.1:28-729(-)